MKLLVCGGAGFIGSNFVHHILQTRPDASVVNFDALTYAGNRDNHTHLENDPHYKFVHGNICDADALERAIADHKPDAIINFAAETHVDRSIHLGSREFVMTNTVGVQTLLDVVRRLNVSRFIQVSTDEVFGTLPLKGGEPFREDTAFAPNPPYAAAKAGGDLMCRAYFQTFGVPVIVTHCSNNYGPYQFPEKLIPFAIFNALADRPVPIYGDGFYVRDWIYVEDHCAALALILEKGTPGAVYNIGADNERPNIDVVKMILRILQKPENMTVRVEDRPGHDRRYAVDATKIKSELGWRPAYAADRFEEGLRRTVEWYQKNTAWVEALERRKAELNPHIKSL